MARRLLGPIGGPVVFFLVAALVFAGFGWVTVIALRVEQAQREAAAHADQGNNIRLALYRMDVHMLPAIWAEDSRPFYEYITWAPDPEAPSAPPDSARLLASTLPDWIRLHFQVDPATGWSSPQVLPGEAIQQLAVSWPNLPLVNATPDRAALLSSCRERFPAPQVAAVFAARNLSVPYDTPPVAAYAADPPTQDLPAPPVAQLTPANMYPVLPPVSSPPQDSPAPIVKNTRNQADSPFQPQANGPAAQMTNPPALGQNLPATNLAFTNGRSKNDRQQVQNPNDEFSNRAKAITRGLTEAKPSYGQQLYYQNSLNPSVGQQQTPNYLQVPANGKDPSRTVHPEKAKNPAPDPTTKADKDKAARTGQATPPTGPIAPTVHPPPPIAVHLGSMRPQWLTAADGTELLVLVRAAKLGDRTVYQGVVLDWGKLQEALKEEVTNLFPDAKLVPVKDPAGITPERAMTALPVQLDPGPMPAPASPGWTPLRIGLLIAWVAIAIAFVAVGLSGWSLIDLAERRIRFVSAVTHELRTPLTSLRLYLDLLLSGMVQDEQKRREYLSTLNAESDRLHRLIDNVLDFARLEKRRAGSVARPVKVGELLEQVRQTWAERCHADDKELVVVCMLPSEHEVSTDPHLVQQIVGNLIDNARKYTRDAQDKRIWLSAKPGGHKRVALEVEDRGAGVPKGERHLIFRPFRRGESADTKAGGAGLGLALARQWAEVLGGRLSYRPADGGTGACFRLELPMT